MEILKAVREFRYNSVVLPDPDPNLTIEQVRDTFAALYPEIVNADVEGPETAGAKMIYTFRRAVGTKGGRRITTIVQDWGDLHRVMMGFMAECPVLAPDGNPLQVTIDINATDEDGTVVYIGGQLPQIAEG